MTEIRAGRPGPDEYDPAFAGYVAHLDETELVVEVLKDQVEGVSRRFGDLEESRGDYRYAPGKWSLKELIGHLSDTERVFAYRALRVGRRDSTPLLGFDDQSYVPEMRAEDRTLAGVVEEWVAIRHATLALFRGFPEPAWALRGSASGHPISVRALAFVIAGHTRHHLQVVDARYGG